MELYKASNQWATRPADERFWDLQEMIQQCSHYRENAAEATLNFKDLRVEADSGEVRLVGKTKVPALLTHWAFGQVCQRVGAPSAYIRNLPATLAAQNINHGFSRMDERTEEAGATKLMFHKNGDLVLRAATGTGYKRIWNTDIAKRLQEILPVGWQVPPARPAGIKNERTRQATQQDVLRLQKQGLSIRVGDTIAPAGIYASDHDCFIFMVNEDRMIDDGTGHGLGRGFFIWNSEVGAASFGIMTFLYDAICGNHIVWGAKGVQEIRVRHIGNADQKAFSGVRTELIKYADSSANETEAKILKARALVLGKTKDEVFDEILKHMTKGRAMISRKSLGEAYEVAEKEERYGAPNTAWAMANGLTEISQKTDYTDERIKLDRAAGKILEIAF